MQVSKNSWHYKLNNVFSDGEYTPRDLCSYFWRTVRSAILPFFIVAVLGWWVYSIIRVIIMLIDNFWGTALMIAVVSVGMLIFIGLWFLAKKLSRPIKHKRLRVSESLIGQYVSAKKRRVCPLIELKD